MEQYDSMLIQTDTYNAPWTIVEAMDKKYALYKVMNTVVKRLEAAVLQFKKDNTVLDAVPDIVEGQILCCTLD